MMTIFEDYRRVIQSERKLSGKNYQIPSAKNICFLAMQLAHVAKNSLVLRSYNLRYGLTRKNEVFESVGAHTNLVLALVDRALLYRYGPDFEFVETEDGYSYREVMEAARRHDLPENETGDIPDNGSRDDFEKIRREQLFQKKFASFSSFESAEFEQKVAKLLCEMEEKSSSTGRLLYCADKVAALVITLTLDDVGKPPLIAKRSRGLSARDLEEMSLCDYSERRRFRLRRYYRASEMWAIDFFKSRQLVQFDDTGFFTALIVIYTLTVHKRWYNWREKDYSN